MADSSSSINNDYITTEIEGVKVIARDIIIVSLISVPLGIGAVGWLIGKYTKKMLPKSGVSNGTPFVYFDKTQPQTLGGYINFYESFTSNEQVCDIDALKTIFINENQKETAIWLWKGDYNMVPLRSWYTGAEVGAYTQNLADNSIFHSVSWRLVKTIGVATLRDVLLLEREVNDEFWINGFVKGKNGVASFLKMYATLNFNSSYNAIASLNAYNKTLNSQRYFPSNNINGSNRNFEEVKHPPAISINTNKVLLTWQ